MAAGATAWLLVRKGVNQGSVFDLKEGRMTIGREPDNDVQLDHKSISSSHVMIRVTQDSYVLYDMGSIAGTWVNGSPVTGVPLADGSRISMGGSELFFSLVGSGEPDKKSEGPSAGIIMVRSGPSAGKSFPVEDEDLIIGRQPGEGGAKLDDSAISQRHALVRPTPEGCTLYDLGSFNGTTVDDVALAGAVLKNGDLLKLGDMELQFLQEKNK